MKRLDDRCATFNFSFDHEAMLRILGVLYGFGGVGGLRAPHHRFRGYEIRNEVALGGERRGL